MEVGVRVVRISKGAVSLTSRDGPKVTYLKYHTVVFGIFWFTQRGVAPVELNNLRRGCLDICCSNYKSE